MKLWLSVLLLILVASGASIAQSQPAQKVARVGYLTPVTNTEDAPYFEAFRQEMQRLGWQEGGNLIIEQRRGPADQLERLAAELVRLKADLIVTDGTQASLAAKRVTSTIPIVMGLIGDPVGTGLVASLAQPGGNVTGISLMAPDLAGKRLELLREIAPKTRRVAVLVNSANLSHPASMKEAKTAASALGLEVRFFSARSAGELDAAFGAMADWRAQALWMIDDAGMYTHFRKVVRYAAAKRLPSVFDEREYAAGGGLMSYGPNYPREFRRAATFVDKILKGAKPADLPVEQPMRFDLVVNEKTAKALGVTIPESILVRAEMIR
jgi:putative tryptophan/tyrosine transport system substrate-binding protein